MEPVFVGNEESASDLNRDIALMVKEISRIGPHVPEVARRLGRHKETVRYWYNKLQEHKFAVQGIVNHEALGLSRIMYKVRFGQEYADYVKPLMFAMNELCYIVGYNKTLPEDFYILNASVPRDHVGEYLDFMEDLRSQGVFTELDPYVFDWFRNIPMRAEYYDFACGRWNFDMSKLTGNSNEKVAEPMISPVQRVDKIDLLITKELSADAGRELLEIQKAIREIDGVDINYKTLCWHLKEHIEAKGLLKGYRTNWMGTHYDARSNRASQRQHAYTGAELFVHRPTPSERIELLKRMAALPVMWSEAAGRDYSVHMAIPNDMVVEGLEYIHDTMRPIREKSRFYLMDQKDAAGFTFSYKLFNEEERCWNFEKDVLLEKFKAFELQVKNM